MKRPGFTLIEMLIVVAVLVTLMSMVFRLSSIGGDTTARNNTVARLQRLENCLSGYYAAFGTYPPVALHGTRDINVEVSNHGIQTSNEKDVPWNNQSQAWQQVQAACRAQPVDVAFPFPSQYQSYVAQVSEELKAKANSSDSAYAAFRAEGVREKLMAGFNALDDSTRGSVINPYADETDWRDVQVFKFGLMSYLLPRYLVMMYGDSAYLKMAQWSANNNLPADPITGIKFNGWEAISNYVQSDNATDLMRVSNIPSQSICARWMPNLENTCNAEHTWELFGVNITYSGGNTKNVRSTNPNINVYTPGPADNDSGYANQYVLDTITVQDGWGNDLYYYSPAPYQSYVLWSAGPNGKTFPPWIPLDTYQGNSTATSVISAWIKDDIMNLSN